MRIHPFIPAVALFCVFAPLRSIAAYPPVTVTVGGNTATSVLTPTVTAGAYTAGQVIGGLLTLPAAARTSAYYPSGLIQYVSITALSGATGTFDVVFFDANPSTSTVTNGGALSVSAADASKVIGVAHVTDCSLLAASTINFCQVGQLAMPFRLATNGAAYAVIVARSSVTLGSTSDIVINVATLQD